MKPREDGLEVHVWPWRFLALLPLLLPINSCGSGGTGSDETRGTGGDETRGTGGNETRGTGGNETALPDGLAGQWNTILTYVPAYYEGIVANSDFIGSIGITLYFSPNGSYQFDLDSAMTYFGGNCFRTTHWSETGTVDIAGSNITFTSAHAINSILDSCGESEYVDPAPTGTATYSMTREQDQTGWPMLRLRLPSGEDLVLERCRDCR